MNKQISMTHLRDRNYVRQGRVTQGRQDIGHHAEIAVGVSIRLHGLDNNRVNGPVAYDLTFKVGDEAEYDSYNFSYTGKILAIGEKTVSIQGNGKTARLSIYDFSRRNRDFDAVKVAARNADTFASI